jgi:iron complex transport system substrate-binding protein
MGNRLRVPILIFLLTLAAACAPPGAGQTPIVSRSASVQSSASPGQAPHTDYPVTLTDDAGREVTLEEHPERIVSLAPSNTEIVCALNACDELVGVTDFDDYPPEVKDVPDVVIYAQVDVEKVVAAEPGLVLAAGNEQTPSRVIEQLEELGLTVMVLYPERLEEIYDEIELVGEALDEQQAAAELVADMRERVAEVEEAVAGADRPRTFYEVSVFQGTIYTAGKDSFLASLVETAGGEPITGDAQGVIQPEELVVADPELILLGDAAYQPRVTPADVRERGPAWQRLTAVQEDAIIPMPEDVLITRPGPRIVDGLEALAAAIHPERF